MPMHHAWCRRPNRSRRRSTRRLAHGSRTAIVGGYDTAITALDLSAAALAESSRVTQGRTSCAADAEPLAPGGPACATVALGEVARVVPCEQPHSAAIRLSARMMIERSITAWDLGV